jgi:hypothetical protein
MSVLKVIGEALENRWFEVPEKDGIVYVRLSVINDYLGREKITYFSVAFDKDHKLFMPLFYRGHDFEYFAQFNEVEDQELVVQFTAFEAKYLLGGKE